MELVKQKHESRSKPTKRASCSKNGVKVTAFRCHTMTVEQERRFTTATDALLAEIVRQEMGRNK
jgi:hypothetical protein